MATLYAQSTGNWSAINWNTAADGSGTNQTPGVADTLVSNGYNVTVDGNYTVTRVNNTSGGTFYLADGVTLTATDSTAGVLGVAAGSTVTSTLTTGQSATIVGHVLGSSTVPAHGISITGVGGSLTVTGNITAGPGANGIVISGAHTLTVTGNVTGSATGTPHGISVNAASTITITGNVTGGSSSANYGCGIRLLAVTTLTITGTVNGAVVASAGIYNTEASIISITAPNDGNAVVASGGVGLFNSNASAVITAIGPLIPSAGSPAISSTADATILLTGPFCANASGRHAVWAPKWLWHSSASSSTRFEVYTHNLETKRSLYTADAVGGNPAATNVRSGTTYGPLNELIGTLAVPAAGSVACGVPVDNTTGTAVLRQQDVAAAVGPIWAAG